MAEQRVHNTVITYPSSRWLKQTATVLHIDKAHPGRVCDHDGEATDRDCKARIKNWLLVVVAVEGRGPVDDWAAYCDSRESLRLTAEGQDSIEMVTRHGSKILPQDAARLFPDWEESDLIWRP